MKLNETHSRTQKYGNRQLFIVLREQKNAVLHADYGDGVARGPMSPRAKILGASSPWAPRSRRLWSIHYTVQSSLQLSVDRRYDSCNRCVDRCGMIMPCISSCYVFLCIGLTDTSELSGTVWQSNHTLHSSAVVWFRLICSCMSRFVVTFVASKSVQEDLDRLPENVRIFSDVLFYVSQNVKAKEILWPSPQFAFYLMIFVRQSS